LLLLLLQVVVALPRILKPDESRLLWFYLKLGADALLLRGERPTADCYIQGDEHENAVLGHLLSSR
jgi:hypothetical protein